MPKILFVVTGSDHWTLADDTHHPTGFWADEVALPYEVFSAAGYEVVVATPGGAPAPVDRASLAAEFNGGQEGADRVGETLASVAGLQQPLKLEDVDLVAYDAVFCPGGHGPMEDLAVDAASGRLLAAALASGRPLGVVCHASAALLPARTADGDWPFAGYRLTGFTNAEEAQAGFADRAKWLLQDRLVEAGADFREGEPWRPHILVDRNLHTGQNPASARPLAQEMVEALR
ncbi:type 1 glutamine amidotransferase domain-containing protein [Streptomyces hypolithicus]